MNLAQMTTFLGIPFQRLDDVCFAVGVGLILLGVWLRNQLGEVQMLAEEAGESALRSTRSTAEIVIDDAHSSPVHRRETWAR